MTNPNIAESDRGLSLEQRRAFLKLPLEERRRLMQEQADRIAQHYESQSEVTERNEWQGGDIVDV